MKPDQLPVRSTEQTPAPKERAFVRLRLLLAYDGTAFRGFAYQNETLPTVALALRRALAKLAGDEPELIVAGRTDAGVHAWGQVVSLDFPIDRLERFGADRIKKTLNKLLRPSIVIRAVEVAPGDFHARFSATGRSYRYTVRNAVDASPFTVNTAWHVPESLDLDAMNLAAQDLVGEQDFSSFCRRPTPPPGAPEPSMTRRVTSAEWLRIDEDTVRFDVSANAFCHQQVRSMVGMLVAIGKGQRTVAQMAEVLAALDRGAAVSPAPGTGLCLWEVQY